MNTDKQSDNHASSWAFAADVFCSVLEREHSTFEQRKMAREQIIKLATLVDDYMADYRSQIQAVKEATNV